MGRNQRIVVGALTGTMVPMFALVWLGKLTGTELAGFAQTFVPMMTGIAITGSAVIKGSANVAGAMAARKPAAAG